MTIGEFIANGGGLVFIVMSLIEISPIKLNPWKAVARWIGSAINKDITDEVNEIKSQIDKIDATINNMREAAQERYVILCRTRILRFGDELLHGTHHSKEHFDQILSDINDYESYCESHHNFKNNQAIMTIRHIKTVYTECMKDQSFT